MGAPGKEFQGPITIPRVPPAVDPFPPIPEPGRVPERVPPTSTSPTGAEQSTAAELSVELAHLIVSSATVVGAILALPMTANPERVGGVIVNFWYPEVVEGMRLGQFSVQTMLPTSELPGMDTNLVGLRQTWIEEVDESLPAPSVSFFVPVPNARAAYLQQFDELGTDRGRWNPNTNSCMTHVLRVLQAGGYPVPH